ncbi:aspartate carbamoyltransferase [Candidatus Berkelbacteria bacterium RIFCSPHIGHO2_12_FULL_50_11]|nr:MAG: aspartate carbamoyltransferase [Candidatus Berkelbacteria bacterium RIFCSPHIGHO2_12_FULL_50_11]
MNELFDRDILSGEQFTLDEIQTVMGVAHDMRRRVAHGTHLDNCHGKVLASLFFEPSTRTRLSFETAMLRLGGQGIGFSSAESTSVSKGETLSDTIQMADQFANVIAMRHPRVGSAHEAAAVAVRPVINGGDGIGQHPTQALLDLFTLQQELGDFDGRTIALVGDLRHGRTVHSAVEIYKHFNCRLILVSPEQLMLQRPMVESLHKSGVAVTETTDLESALSASDAVYMTRIQKERFADPSEYEKVKGCYVLNRELIMRTNSRIVVLHPLPRVDEISTDVDDLPGAAYFRQAQNGVYVRMALIAMVLGKA